MGLTKPDFGVGLTLLEILLAAGWTRDATGVVRLTTITDQVGIGTATPAAGRKVEVLETASGSGLRATGLLSTSVAHEAGVTLDAFQRWTVLASGAMTWGSGALAQDVLVSRTAASVLTLTNNAGGGAVLRLGAAADTATDGTAGTVHAAGFLISELGFVSRGGATVGNARGTGAADLQVMRAAATQVASGAQAALWGSSSTSSGTGSTAGGGTCIASAPNTVSIGVLCSATTSRSVAIGDTLTSTGSSSYAFGSTNTSSATAAGALGFQASTAHYGTLGWMSGQFAAIGDAQGELPIWRVTTTDATANVEAFLDGAAAAQRFVLVNDSHYVYDLRFVARRTDSNQTGFSGRIAGSILRHTNAASTALEGTQALETFSAFTGTGAIVVDADGANGALRVRVTGIAAQNWRWTIQGRIQRVTG